VRRSRILAATLRVARRLDRARARARVRRLRRRLRFLALWRGARIDVDIAPTALVARRVNLEFWGGTRNRISVGAGSRIGDDVKLSFRGGSLVVGDNTDIRRFGTYHIGGDLTIGSGCVMSTGMHVHCAERLSVGDRTIIGEYTTIADSRHLRTGPDEPVHHATVTAPVDIGCNIWMGAHAVVASGVTIGDMAFVAAGAVVTKDVAQRWLVGGIPARPLRELQIESG
jgi:acetyltransferase-like isoleucine patch superfamily enzyme